MKIHSNHTHHEDLQGKLIEECKKGSRKAQNEIYRRYYRAMFNASMRIVNNRFEAEDVMQEAFLKAFENMGQFRGEVTFGAWLKRIVINRSVDALRKMNKLPTEPLENHAAEKFSEINEQEYAEAGPGDIHRIKEEIFRLPEGYRIVLSLYLLEGYDHDEIGEILGISPSTSRSQYSRAKHKLLRNLKKKTNDRF